MREIRMSGSVGRGLRPPYPIRLVRECPRQARAVAARLFISLAGGTWMAQECAAAPVAVEKSRGAGRR